MPVVEAVKGAPALITLASYLVAVIPSVTRAAMPIPATTVAQTSDKKWFRNFAQGDKWNFCLTAGTLVPANEEKP